MKKAKGKVSEVVADFCGRLGAYRQHFCWSAIQLIDEKGELKVGPHITYLLLLFSLLTQLFR